MTQDALKALEAIELFCIRCRDYKGEWPDDVPKLFVGHTKTIRAALTAQAETGDDWLVEMVAKEDAEFLNAGGKFHTIDVTPPRTEEATDAVTLSKEDFERMKQFMIIVANTAWLKDKHGFEKKADKILSILEKEIKP